MNKLNEDFVRSMIELVQLVKYEYISFSHFMRNFDDLLSTLATEKLIHKLPWSAILNNLEKRLNLNSQPSLLILRKNYVYGKRKINNEIEKSIIDSIFSVINEYDHKGLNNVVINHTQAPVCKQESTTSNENDFSNVLKYQRTKAVNGLCKSLDNLPRLPYISSKLNKCEENKYQHSFLSEVAATASKDDTTNEEACQVNKIRNDKNDKKLSSWGQRKLLLTEIYFLSCYAVPGDTILYVGTY